MTVQQEYVNAVNLRDAGKYNEALKKFDYVIRSASSSSDIYKFSHLNLGHIYFELGKEKIAEEHFKETIRIDSNYEKGYNNLATIYMKQNRINEAKKLLTKALTINPQYLKGYINLVSIFIEENNLTEAEKWCERSLKINPKSGITHASCAQLYNAQGNLKKAVESFEISKKNIHEYVDRESKVQIYRELAKLYEKLYTHEPQNKFYLLESIKNYKEFLKLSPDDYNILDKLGFLYHSQEDYQNSEIYYKKAVEIAKNMTGDVNHKILYYTMQNLALVYFEQTKYYEAKDLYKLIEENSPHYEAYVNQANLYSEMGKIQDAYVIIHKAITLNPNSYEAYINLGNILEKIGLKIQKNNLISQTVNEAFGTSVEEIYKLSLNAFNKALSIDSTSVVAYQNKAAILKRLGYQEEAIKAQESALKIDSNAKSLEEFTYINSHGILKFENNHKITIADSLEDFIDLAQDTKGYVHQDTECNGWWNDCY